MNGTVSSDTHLTPTDFNVFVSMYEDLNTFTSTPELLRDSLHQRYTHTHTHTNTHTHTHTHTQKLPSNTHWASFINLMYKRAHIRVHK